MIVVSKRRFEQLVADALDAMPDDLAALMDNVAVIVADEGEDPGILGLYDGIPLTEREEYTFVLPDRIYLYRKAITAVCESEQDVVDEIYITVVHEIAHHFGIDDDRLDELGWA